MKKNKEIKRLRDKVKGLRKERKYWKHLAWVRLRRLIDTMPLPEPVDADKLNANFEFPHNATFASVPPEAVTDTVIIKDHADGSET